MLLSNEPSPTLSPVEAKQLLAFAEQGRLYEIEAWIRAGNSGRNRAPPGSAASGLNGNSPRSWLGMTAMGENVTRSKSSWMMRRGSTRTPEQSSCWR